MNEPYPGAEADLSEVDALVDAQAGDDTPKGKWYRVSVPDYDPAASDPVGCYLRLGRAPSEPEPGDEFVREVAAEAAAVVEVSAAAYAPLSGVRDHADGTRVVTTHGDKLEIVTGNYKMIVGGEEAPPVIQQSTTVISITEQVETKEDRVSHTFIGGGRVENTTITGGDVSSLEVGGGIASNTNVGGGVIDNTMVGGGVVSNTTIGGAEHSTKQVVGIALDRTDVGIDMSSHTLVGGMKTDRTEVVGLSVSHESVGAAKLSQTDVIGFAIDNTMIGLGRQSATQIALSSEEHKHVGALDMSLTTAGTVLSLGMYGGRMSVDLVAGQTDVVAGAAKLSVALWGLDVSVGIGAKIGVHLGAEDSTTLPKVKKIEVGVDETTGTYTLTSGAVTITTAGTCALTAATTTITGTVKLGA